ncbi:hypothetical protein Tco_1563627 [Tanacetum coccineum]
MAYMNKNYGTLPVTAEQLLDIKTAQVEETVPEPQYQFSVIKFSLAIVTPIVSMYLMSLISIIFKTEPSDMIYIMLLAYTYAVFAACFLTNIYGDAKVNPLRSIRVRALEASYYMGMAHMHNNLFTSQVTPEPLDIEMAQAEEMRLVQCTFYPSMLGLCVALLAGHFLLSIYSEATVNPLRSICVRALEASYYVGLLLSLLFSVLWFFPHAKNVFWGVSSCGIAMLVAALIFIFNGCGIRVLRVVA